MRLFFLLGLIFVAPLVEAATSIQALSPQSVSVEAGTSKVFSVRVLNSGQPSAGETVRFSNDACGRFSNGAFMIDVTSDASGAASATFTAMAPGGVTCVVGAAAGAEFRFDVLTWSLPQTRITATTSPPNVQPGQSFSVTAALQIGIYRIQDVELTARAVAISGSAVVSPSGADSGRSGSVNFSVMPNSEQGEYDIEVSFRSLVKRIPVRDLFVSRQDLWWVGEAENGWGISIAQHGDVLFSALYAYDGGGSPTWYVLPGGSWNAAHTAFTSPIYQTRGSPFFAYDVASFVQDSPIGSATFTFIDANNATFDYTINGVSGRKTITRFQFGALGPSSSPTVGDLWWGGALQSGWGVAVLQQGASLFVAWFTYDANGAPIWYYVPTGSWTASDTYEGRVLRAMGSPWLGQTYDPSAFRNYDMGYVRVQFANGQATMEYSVEGHAGVIPLTRFAF